MNSVFDFSRFRLLVGRHWVENSQRYLLSLAAAAGILLLWFIFLFLIENRDQAAPVEAQIATYYVVMFFTGCLMASTMFAQLGSKSKGINYLSVPASHLEKLLVALLYSVVLFFLCYTLVFYVIDFLMLQITNAIAESNFVPNESFPKYIPEPLANVFRYSASENYGTEVQRFNPLYYLLLAYFAVQAAFLAGSIFLSRFAFVKTFIILVVAGLLFWLYIYNLATRAIPGTFISADLTKYMLEVNGVQYHITVPSWMINSGKLLIQYAFPPLFWLATYFRLKEKEI